MRERKTHTGRDRDRGTGRETEADTKRYDSRAAGKRKRGREAGTETLI